MGDQAGRDDQRRSWWPWKGNRRGPANRKIAARISAAQPAEHSGNPHFFTLDKPRCAGRSHGAGRGPWPLGKGPESGRKSRSQFRPLPWIHAQQGVCASVIPLLRLRVGMAFQHADARDSAFSVYTLKSCLHTRGVPCCIESAAHGRAGLGFVADPIKSMVAGQLQGSCKGRFEGLHCVALRRPTFLTLLTGATAQQESPPLLLYACDLWNSEIWDPDCRHQRLTVRRAYAAGSACLSLLWQWGNVANSIRDGVPNAPNQLMRLCQQTAYQSRKRGSSLIIEPG